MKKQRFPTSGPILTLRQRHPELFLNRETENVPPNQENDSSENSLSGPPMKEFIAFPPISEEELQMLREEQGIVVKRTEKGYYYPYDKVDPMSLSKYLLYIHEKKGIPNSNPPNRYLRQAKKLIDTYGKQNVKVAMIHIYNNLSRIEHPFGFKLVEDTILRFREWEKGNHSNHPSY